MKIIKHGNKKKVLKGECSTCGCKIECESAEAATLIDRDTTSDCATQYVRCPECKTDFLWVK
jgi:hypothetical protein